MRKLLRSSAILIVTAACLTTGSTAFANTFQFSTPVNSTAGGNPVSATALFTVNDGQIIIDLTNNLNDPTSDGQNLNAVTFQILSASGNPTNVPNLGVINEIANAISVNADHTYTAPAPVSVIWGLNLAVGTAGNPSTVASLCVLGGCNPNGNPGASQTLIGGPAADNKYDSANSSIINNNHIPYLYRTAEFVLSSNLITTSSRIGGATFSFGTSAGSNVTAQSVSPVPEPDTIALLAGGILLMVLGSQRLRRIALAHRLLSVHSSNKQFTTDAGCGRAS